MLEITLKGEDSWDEVREEFVSTNDVVLQLEHSLVSLSKWESEWEKPFLGPEPKTSEELLSYIKAMTLGPNLPDEVYGRLRESDIRRIDEYFNAKMTATWFAEDSKKTRNREIITAEVIYYWMVSLSIPFECQHWHLNRLITLVKVCNEKNQPEKKKSPAEIAARNRELNAQRKAQMNTKG